ncbi:MAG: hypothetical protein WCA35_13355 [Kovacikia sp.]
MAERAQLEKMGDRSSGLGSDPGFSEEAIAGHKLRHDSGLGNWEGGDRSSSEEASKSRGERLSG